MRNVYLSFLGTNPYLKCIYTHPALKKPRPSRYVQTATLRLFDSFRVSESAENDVAYFFLTKEAKTKNWLRGGYKDAETNKPCEGLERSIQNLKLPFKTEVVDIPKGENEKELWQIFDLVYQVIREGDKITFDVTHAFRSIPLFAVVILAYARTLRQASIERIYYGAFETLGTLQQAKGKPLKQRHAPIFDLTTLIYLLDWTMAVHLFLKVGDSSSIVSLIRARALPTLKATEGKDPTAQELKRIAKLLEKFSTCLSTCRSTQIGGTACELTKKLATLEKGELVKPPFGPLLERLRERIAQFDGKNVVKDGLRAAKWCLEHNLIQQGFTLLQETVYTHLLSQAGEHPPPHKREIREVAGQALKIHREKLRQENWKDSASKNRELTDKIVAAIKRSPLLSGVMDKLSAKRNDLNHAGTVTDSLSDGQPFKKELETLIHEVEKVLLD